MIHIHFIVNPIAGSGDNKINIKFLQRYFSKDTYVLVVKHSVYKKHAVELTKESIKEKAHVIVACGGDGTINEVASCIIDTSILFGVIPLGSGNGLASNLKISKNIEQAISIIKKQDVKTIDVGSFNNNYFFSNSGIGFDAMVIKNYEESNNRKLLSYIKATLKSLKDIKYDNEYNITINEENLVLKPFMIFVSNSNVLGYKVSLTPKASLQDGLLDVLIVSKLNFFKVVLFCLLMLFKKHYLLKEVKSYQTKNLSIYQKESNHYDMQIDGEHRIVNHSKIEFSIKEKTLRIIS
ncbi:diacylglycerol/lipid kinase family protein [Yeosuana marina]|uniref:diacylglycerol/lipid kinase family protein n=1 Tax=Yeosuana marina TaxID=1565536 RepID=UPI0030EF51F1